MPTMRKKPTLAIDHLSTTRVQINGTSLHRHCFEWHNRQYGGEVKLIIELLNGQGKVQHTSTVSVSPMRRINNPQIIIEEAHNPMPVLFRYRTGQGWEMSQSATGEFAGGYLDPDTEEVDVRL